MALLFGIVGVGTVPLPKLEVGVENKSFFIISELNCTSSAFDFFPFYDQDALG